MQPTDARFGASTQHDGTGLIALDPWLAPYAGALRRRYTLYRDMLFTLTQGQTSLANFATGHMHYGFTRGSQRGRHGLWYREWAPGAAQLSLVGEFNGWNRLAHPMQRDPHGVWSVFLPDSEYAGKIGHGSRVKVNVQSAAGNADRIPAYIRRVEFDAGGHNATGVVWLPPEFRWKHERPVVRHAPRIYEAHAGMALEAERVGTFGEFTAEVLPRIARAGYNTLQLMAVQEHPYYGSFGYHVSNFFAVSSRFGTPEDFKALVDAAHGLGIRVLLDLVHSHSVKNTVEGLNRLDGTDHLYFHAGPRGEHPAWDSLLFDYSKYEVLRFLLSNVRYWLEEYNIDGFRFDGVTSMMYTHHGLGHGFHSYDDYLVNHIDEAAVAYLTLANQVAHEVCPSCTTIAEDVSGMVGLCRPIEEGGIGFDYRLAMGIPDYWIKVLKEKRDEDWSMGETVRVLTNRREHEKHVAYVESHDQALVGDKTLAFWLMDKEMYWHMNTGSRSLIIDRGIALHKMIRLVTFALGGEGYLNFIGNEFGHPEWIDFPREGNGYSYKYARRQWSLVDHPDLRYQHLAEFDRAMMELDERYGVLDRERAHIGDADEGKKVILCSRGPLVFAFNFHPTASHTDLRVGVPGTSDYGIVLNSDEGRFGGHDLVKHERPYPNTTVHAGHRLNSVLIYLPARSVQVLAPV
jgi:1,4-alpha-glucan branching enzyme